HEVPGSVIMEQHYSCGRKRRGNAAHVYCPSSGRISRSHNVSLDDCEDGFYINAAPSRRPLPAVAANAIDQSRWPELWGWRPGVSFPAHFRESSALSFWCFRTRAGHRVFFPLRTWSEFVRIEARYGIAVIEEATDAATAEYHALMLL